MATERKDIITDAAFNVPSAYAKEWKLLDTELKAVIASAKLIGTSIAGANSIPKVKENVEKLTAAEKELAKIQAQILTVQAKTTDAYAAEKNKLNDLNNALKTKIALGDRDSLLVTKENASRKELQAALAKNIEAYGKLANEQERNSTAGKKLLSTIQQQDKGVKELNQETGRFQDNVGNYPTILAGLDKGFGAVNPKLQGFATSIASATKAALAFIATPIGAVLAAVVAAVAILSKAVTVFFDETLEGQEKLNELSSYYTGITEQISENLKGLGKDVVDSLDNPTQALKDFGQLIYDNIINRFKGMAEVAVQSYNIVKRVFTGGDVKQALLDLGDAFIQIGTGITDVSGKAGEFLDAAKKKQLIALELAKLENNLIKERTKDKVDDAHTELQVNELLEKSKNKLIYTDTQRLKYLRDANVLLKAQLEGDIVLAKLNLDTVQKEITLKGGIIQKDKLISNYTQQELIALKINRDGIQKLADAQVELLKIQSDASAKRKALSKSENTLVEEIYKSEKDKADRLYKANTDFDIRITEGKIAVNEAILKNSKSSLIQQEEAYSNNLINRLHLLDLQKDVELRTADEIARERIRAEGKNVESEIKNDKALKIQLLAIEKDYITKEDAIIKESMDAISSIYVTGYNKQIEDKKRAFRDSYAADQQRYARGEIGLREYEKITKKFNDDITTAEKDGNNAILKDEIDAYAKLIDVVKSKGGDVVDLEKHIQDLRVANAKVAADDRYETEKELQDKLKELGQTSYKAIIDISRNLTTNDINNINAKERRLKESYDKDTAAAGDNAKLKEKIQKNFDIKQAQLEREKIKEQRKQAQFEKLLAIAKATVEGAAATVKGLEKGPIYAAIIAALAAIQIATIASTPIPQYYVGTESSKGGLAWVGERGSEMIVTPSGEIQFTPSRPTLTTLEAGTKIYTANETRAIGSMAMAAMGRDNTLGTAKDAQLNGEVVNELRGIKKAVVDNNSTQSTLVASGSALYEFEERAREFKKRRKIAALGAWIKN